MTRIAARSFAALLAALVSSSALAPSARGQGTPLAGVAEALGRSGAEQPGGVTRFSFPRSDLTVVADSVTLKPAFALGSWIAAAKPCGLSVREDASPITKNTSRFLPHAIVG